MFSRVITSLLIFAGLGACAAATSRAQGPRDEYEVKVAYLYNFSKYVDWPPRAMGQEFLIGLLGADPTAGAFAKLAGKPVNDRVAVAKVFSASDDFSRCQILFIPGGGDASRKLLALAREKLAGKPVLVVTELPDGLSQGAAVNFVTVAGNVKFEIQRATASQVNLQINAKLLRVALAVKP